MILLWFSHPSLTDGDFLYKYKCPLQKGDFVFRAFPISALSQNHQLKITLILCKEWHILEWHTDLPYPPPPQVFYGHPVSVTKNLGLFVPTARKDSDFCSYHGGRSKVDSVRGGMRFPQCVHVTEFWLLKHKNVESIQNKSKQRFKGKI